MNAVLIVAIGAVVYKAVYRIVLRRLNRTTRGVR